MVEIAQGVVRANVLVVDYGLGNVAAVGRLFEAVGAKVRFGSDADSVLAADLVVLGGVGHFGIAAERLHRSGIVAMLRERVLGRSRPVLGICLGMQLLAESSEEAPGSEGVGLIRGSVRHLGRLALPPDARIPNIGWHSLHAEAGSTLARWLLPGQRFYFSHSYDLCVSDDSIVAGSIAWGQSRVVAAIRGGPPAGFQFHPEKSLRWGSAVIRGLLQDLGC